jgi:hypothetical protein
MGLSNTMALIFTEAHASLSITLDIRALQPLVLAENEVAYYSRPNTGSKGIHRNSAKLQK